MARSRGEVVGTLGIILLMLVAGQTGAYHQIETPTLVYEDTPSPDVLDSDPKVAVATYGANKWVYTAWWHLTSPAQLMFRRQYNPVGEGDGSWTFEAPQVLATVSMVLTGPEHRDLAIAAYASSVYVAWTEQVSGAPSKVWVAANGANGGPPGLWGYWVPADDPNYNFLEPDLTLTDQYAWLTRVRYSATSPYRVQLVRLNPIPETVVDVTQDTLVYERGTFSPWFLSPDWQVGTRATLSTTIGTPDSQGKLAVAAFGFGVAVVYLQDLNSPPYTRRNRHNGDVAWDAAQPVDSVTHRAAEVDVAVDARFEIAGEKGNVVQYVWSRIDGVTARQDISHTIIRTEEREQEVGTFGGLSVVQGQSVAYNPAGPRAYIFGGDVPNPTNQIWRFNLASQTVEATGHVLPQAVGYTSAVWDPDPTWRIGAYVFGGSTTTDLVNPGAVNCVAYYATDRNAWCVRTLPSARSATSAVYDPQTVPGVGYAYVFGGRTLAGADLNEILRFNTDTETFETWGACAAPTLPVGISYSSAAWEPTAGVAYIFGGMSGYYTYNHYLMFDPVSPSTGCPAVTELGVMPFQTWDDQLQRTPSTATTAVLVDGVGSILVAGGRYTDDSPIGGGTIFAVANIYEYSTFLDLWTLNYVDMPAPKSDGAAFWYSTGPAAGRMYYFGGGNDQVIRYDVNTH